MTSIRWALFAALPIALSACVVAPVGPAYGPPRGVVYVAPTYAMPAPGYAWQYGWGWRHPHYGWHRGWH